MKLVILIFQLLILISCGDNLTVNNPDPLVSKAAFPIDTGYYWYYKSDDGMEIQLNVILEDSIKWNIKYWDTSKTVNLRSFIIEGKFIESGFPKIQYFAVSKTDSGYLIGMQGFSFTYTEEVPCFVKMFLIPDSIIQRTQYNYLDIGNFYYADSTSFESSNSILIDSELYNLWRINNYFIFDYLQRKFIMNNFIFADKFGFYKFMNCELTDFKIKL
jgi:hypothetical protein